MLRGALVTSQLFAASGASDPGGDGPAVGHGPSPLLEIADLRVSFRSRAGEIRAVRGVNLSLGEGQTLGIVGESGSGKSVTVRALMGILPERTAVVTGSARFEGADLLALTRRERRKYLGRDLAMVFQDPMRSLNPTMQIGRQIVEAIRNHERVDAEQARAKAIDLLRQVRMSVPETRFHQYPHQLSGGMRQRVMIAIAIACRPRLLIADESTTALDVTTQAQIMELFRDLQQELKMGLVLVSHDLALTARYTDRLAVMYAGRIVESGVTADVFNRPRMPYTKGLLESVPRRGANRHERLPTITGSPPDSLEVARGCAFQPRCPYATDRCAAEQPELVRAEGEQMYACWNPLEVPSRTRPHA